MRNIVSIAMACELLSACGTYQPFRAREPAYGFPVSQGAASEAKTVPDNTVVHRRLAKGRSIAISPKLITKYQYKTVPSNTVVHRMLTNAKSEASASQLTPKEQGNRIQEAPAAREGADRRGGAPAVSPSPGFKVADGTVIARDESMKIVQFAGTDLSDRDCYLLTGQLTLRSNGTGVFKNNILGMGTKHGRSTYKFSLHYYDKQSHLLAQIPDFAHEISEQHTIREVTHEMTFNMSDFEKIEHVKINFGCEKEGSVGLWANTRSLSTVLSPKIEGNQGRCNAEAATHRGPGAAYTTLTSQCLDGSQSLARQRTPSAEAPPTTAVQPDSPAPANALSRARHDEQQRKWDVTARRNIDSICTGCTGQGRSPPRHPADVEPKVQRR